MANKSQSSSKYSSLAITGFVFSLLFFIPLFAIVGIILGICALFSLKKNPKLKGKGLAISSIIIGTFVVIIQAILFYLVFSLFSTMFGGIDFETGEVNMDYCISQKEGLAKDTCIFMAVAASVNSTEKIDLDTCDDYVKNADIKNYCNAILRKDSSYCQNITGSNERFKCIGMVQELKSGSVKKS